MRTYKQGFTLIELLVSIGIVIVLSAIIFTALGAARNKGKGARIQTETVQIRTQLEYGYDSLKYADLTASAAPPREDNYSTGSKWAAGGSLKLLKDDITTSQGGGLKIYDGGSVASTITAYAIYVYYPGSIGGYCLDSTGANKSNYAGVAAFTTASDFVTCAASTGL